MALLTSEDQASLLDAETVTICLDQPTSYDRKVLKVLLCKDSAFFRAAFTNGQTLESLSNRIKLSGCTSPDLLNTYVTWIYLKKIVFVSSPDSNSANAETQVTIKNIGLFVDLYILADKYDTKELRNHVVTKLIKYARDDFLLGHADEPSVDPSVLATVFDSLPLASMLSKLFISIMCWDIGSRRIDHPTRDWESIAEVVPQAALGKVMEFLTMPKGRERNKVFPGRWEWSQCMFHEHAEGEGSCIWTDCGKGGSWLMKDQEKARVKNAALEEEHEDDEEET